MRLNRGNFHAEPGLRAVFSGSLGSEEGVWAWALVYFHEAISGGGVLCASISPSPPARPLAPRRHRRRALCCAAGQGSRMTSPGHRPWECAVLERRHGPSPAETGRRASLPRSDHTTRTRRAVKGRGAVARRLGTDVWGLNTELEKRKTTRRERGCRGRHHRTMARSEVPEDRAMTPRWPARAKTVLPGRSRAVRSCGRIGRNCTTRTPSVPDRTSPIPRGYGECPARTSRPLEPLSATASEGL